MRLQSLWIMVRCYGFFNGIESFFYFLFYSAQKYILRRRFFRRKIFDYTMYLDVHDPGIAKALAIFGKRELEHRFILLKEIRPGMVVWDCGANIGYYAIMEAKLVGAQGRVYAIEPSPANVDLLRKNIAVNNLDHIIEVAEGGISDRNGEADFYLSSMSNVNTFHPTTRSGERAGHLTGATLRVPIMDVPTFLHNKRPVDLVRMDIEGHEVEVFASIIRAVKAGNFSAKILFETHFPKYDDNLHNMRKQLQELFALGYAVKWIASTDERKAFFRQYGYIPATTLRTDGVIRGLYNMVTPKDAMMFICDLGGVRTVLLERL